jgi:hypothetical protein
VQKTRQNCQNAKESRKLGSGFANFYFIKKERKLLANTTPHNVEATTN